MKTFAFADGEKADFEQDSTAADLLDVIFTDVFSEIEVTSRPMTNFKGEKVGETTIFRHVPTNICLEDPKSAKELLKNLISLLDELS